MNEAVTYDKHSTDYALKTCKEVTVPDASVDRTGNTTDTSPPPDDVWKVSDTNQASYEEVEALGTSKGNRKPFQEKANPGIVGFPTPEGNGAATTVS